MEGHGPRTTAIAAVLGDDDLLREILLRLVFPHYLVRAALVSKRWLLHASDPVFLGRFRDRYPPRLLGFCIDYPDKSQFVPFPQPLDLAAISSRAASFCDDAFTRGRQRIHSCRNGRLITTLFEGGRRKGPISLLSPLLAGESEFVLPPSPLPGHSGDWYACISLPEDGRRHGIILARLWKDGRKFSAEVFVLGSGGWGAPTTAATEIQLPYPPPRFSNRLTLVHDKIFMPTTVGYTLELDLTTAGFFILEYPDGVRSNFRLSSADSGLYLVSAQGFQLSVWLHKLTGDDGGGGGWLLVDTFCVHDGFKRAVGDRWVPRVGDSVHVVELGDNAEFVFLGHEASGAVVYVHLRSRVVEKVYDLHDSGQSVFHEICIAPLLMIWPPIFPALN